MQTAPVPANEPERLDALRSYHILDSPPEKAFDAVTRLAAQLCHTSMSVVSLVDEARQWFKSGHGLLACETARDIGFCPHAILGDTLLEVPDARHDARFADNPQVVGAPHIRFYAGAPLIDADGFTLGTLCVVDTQPKQLTEPQREALITLAHVVVEQLALRRQTVRLQQSEQRSQQGEEALQRVLAGMERRVAERTSDLTIVNEYLQQAVAGYEQAGEALRRGEQRYRSLVTATAQIVWTTDARGAVGSEQPTWAAFTGQSFEEIGGWGWLAVIHPDDRAHTEQAFRQAIAGRSVYQLEQRLRRHDGVYRHMSVRGVPVVEPNGSVREWIGTHTDITGHKQAENALREAHDLLEARVQQRTTELEETNLALQQEVAERKRAEHALRESKRFAESVTEHSTSIIYVFDLDTMTNAYSNRDVAQFLGYTHAQIEALGADFLPSVIHPDDLPFMLRHLQEFAGVADGGVVEFEQRVKHVSGEWRWLWNRETVFKRRPDGTPCQIMGTAQDISGRKRAEQEREATVLELRKSEERFRGLAEELARSNNELQQFAFVASHDLQEPLRKIQTFSGRLVDKYGDDLGEQGRDYLLRIRDATGRMQRLINDLLLLSRVATKGDSLVPVDLNAVVSEVLADLEGRVEQSGARVDVDALPIVEADPLQMRQLLQNLIGNALKYHAPSEPPRVGVQARRLEAADPAETAHWEIVVCDNGIGFDEKYLERIFVPFQRLHGRNEYEGTGMGLAICKKIVERHRGTITARSAPGQGATFVVRLPSKQAKKETCDA